MADQIVDANTGSVAIIHDLWNVDKHAGLNRPPRSGRTPKITNLSKAMVVGSDGTEGSASFFSMDPITGKIESGVSGGGSVEHKLVADVVDENGQRIGDFEDICAQALSAWESELTNLGVQLPT